MNQKPLIKIVLILAAITLTSALAYAAKPFLLPFVIAMLLGMLLVPFCRWQESKGLKRGLASFNSVLVFLLVTSGIISLLAWQISGISEDAAMLQENITKQGQKLQQYISNAIGVSKEKQEQMVEQQSSDSTGKTLASFIGGTLGFLTDTVLMIVYMFLLLFYRNHLKQFILKLVKPADKQNAKQVIEESSKVVQSYLGGLAAMIASLWVMYGIGFSIVGVEHAIFFAVLCGILEIVPFVGNLTGTALTVLMTIMQGGSGGMIAGVVGVYIAVQFIQTYILEPLVIGKQVNINPLFTIMVLIIGELVWGIGGIVVAIPLIGIVKIVCEHIESLKPYAFLLGSPGNKKK